MSTGAESFVGRVDCITNTFLSSEVVADSDTQVHYLYFMMSTISSVWP